MPAVAYSSDQCILLDVVADLHFEAALLQVRIVALQTSPVIDRHEVGWPRCGIGIRFGLRDRLQDLHDPARSGGQDWCPTHHREIPGIQARMAVHTVVTLAHLA